MDINWIIKTTRSLGKDMITLKTVTFLIKPNKKSKLLKIIEKYKSAKIYFNGTAWDGKLGFCVDISEEEHDLFLNELALL